MKRGSFIVAVLVLIVAAAASAATVGERATFVVAGSTAGANNSAFRTSLQMANPSSEPIEGELVLYQAGSVGPPFRMPYFVGPNEVVGYRDFVAAFLPITQLAFGSLDIVPIKGRAPVATLRVYNDGGANGTAGMSVDPTLPNQFINVGQRTALLVDNADGTDRVNIGLRTLGGATRIRATVRSSLAGVLKQFERDYPENYFEHVTLAQFTGELPAGAVPASIDIDILRGFAVMYAAHTNNVSNDPIMTVGERIIEEPGITSPSEWTIPVFGESGGEGGATFDSTLTFFNPHGSLVAFIMTYHEQGLPDDRGASRATLGVPPYATRGFSSHLVFDILSKRRGIGSMDLLIDGDVAARMRVRANNGQRGQTGLATPLVSHADALTAGNQALLFTPFDFEHFRMNVGLRALREGATLKASCVSRDGALLSRTHTLPANFFYQISVGDVCGGAAAPNTAVQFQVTSGRAIVYGATTDNLSQDPTLQLARKY
jgi:hypothetical protein